MDCQAVTGACIPVPTACWRRPLRPGVQPPQLPACGPQASRQDRGIRGAASAARSAATWPSGSCHPFARSSGNALPAASPGWSPISTSRRFPGAGQESPQQPQIDAAGVGRAEKHVGMCHPQRIHACAEPLGKRVLHAGQRPFPEVAAQHGRAQQRAFPRHAHHLDAETLQQLRPRPRVTAGIISMY